MKGSDGKLVLCDEERCTVCEWYFGRIMSEEKV